MSKDILEGNEQLKGKIINAIRDSREIQCDCRECQCEKFVIEALMNDKRYHTNEVGCIVDYEDNLKNYDGDEITELLNKQDTIIKLLSAENETYRRKNLELKLKNY